MDASARPANASLSPRCARSTSSRTAAPIVDPSPALQGTASADPFHLRDLILDRSTTRERWNESSPRRPSGVSRTTTPSVRSGIRLGEADMKYIAPVEREPDDVGGPEIVDLTGAEHAAVPSGSRRWIGVLVGLAVAITGFG